MCHVLIMQDEPLMAMDLEFLLEREGASSFSFAAAGGSSNYPVAEVGTTKEEVMTGSPFLKGPRDQAGHIAAAVASPVEELRAIHIRAAEHLAQVARQRGLGRPIQKS